MKDKVLLILSRLPHVGDSRQGERLCALARILVRHYEVHLLYAQSMFDTQESYDFFNSLGVSLLNIRELFKEKKMSMADKIRHLLGSMRYTAAYFENHFIAKYYLPYMQGVSEETALIIDTAKSELITNVLYEHRVSDLNTKYRIKNKILISKMKELSIYNYCDTVLVQHEDIRAMLSQELPAVCIATVPPVTGAAADDATTVQQITQLFEKGHAKKKTDPAQGSLDIVIIRVTAGAPREQFMRRVEQLAGAAVPGHRMSVIEPGSSPLSDFNRGLERITREHGLIFFDDLELTGHSIREMLVCAASHPSNGIVMPSSNLLIGDVFNEHYLDAAAAKHYSANFGFWQELHTVTGRCLLVKKRLLDAAGFLDSRFQGLDAALYDFTLKAFQSGFRALLANEAFVYYPKSGHQKHRPASADSTLLMEKWCDTTLDFLEHMHAL